MRHPYSKPETSNQKLETVSQLTTDNWQLTTAYTGSTCHIS
jgi:hypothetical protein